MTIEVKVGIKQLVEEANREIETVGVAEAAELAASGEAVIVDLRDVRELAREGLIPGAVHMPRGMLEFWLDPESPYFKEIFNEDKRFVLYCAMGWRSALATQTARRMGLEGVCHIDGGFTAWKEAGHPVAEYTKKSSAKKN